MAYDIENFLSDVKRCLIANLGNKLTAITTEKGDGLSLPAPDSGAYYLQDLADAVPPFDPFVVYGEVEEPVSEALGPATAVKYTVGIEIALSDSGIDASIKLRLLRYRRALMEVVQDNWASIGQFALKVKVKGTVPVPWLNENKELVGRVIGILIEVTLA